MTRSQFAGAAAAVLVSVSLGACNISAPATPAATDTNKDADAIRALEDQASAAANAHDFDKFAGLYATDGMVIEAGSPVANGPAAIAKSFGPLAGDKAYNFKLTLDRVEVGGNIGYAVWRYDQASTDPKSHAIVHELGNGVDTLRKGADGTWKFVVTVQVPAPAKS